MPLTKATLETWNDARTAWESLPRDQPLVLLPVRLETRYEPIATDAWFLKVRIYPDALHADIAPAELTTREREAGSAFWRSSAETQRAPSAERKGRADAAWAQLVRACASPWRAIAVARATAQETPARTARSEDARAALLPDRFLAIGLDAKGETLFRVGGLPIPAELPLHPRWSLLDGGTAPVDPGSGLAAGDPVRWMTDFDEAVKVGMGLRIELRSKQVKPATLLVFGVRSAADGAERFRSLLDAHLLTDGLGVVHPGTPTNLIDAEPAAADLGAEVPNLALFAERPYAPALPVDAQNPLAAPAGDALAWALGLSTSPLGALPGGELQAEPKRAAMQHVVWETALAPWFSKIMGADHDTVTEVGAWFERWVRPEGPFAALRVGKQPYGVLPVSTRRSTRDLAGKLERVFQAMRKHWADALPRVPRVDTSADDTTADDAAQTGQLAAILQRHPAPTGVVLRDLTGDRPGGQGEIPQVMRKLASQKEGLGDALKGVAGAVALSLRAPFEKPLAELLAADAPSEQARLARAFTQVLRDHSNPGNHAPMRAWVQATHLVVTSLLGLLTRAEPRAGILQGTGLPAPWTGPLSIQTPAIFETALDEKARSWGKSLVGSDPGAWLGALIENLAEGASPGEPEALSPAQPLLHQLLLAHTRELVTLSKVAILAAQLRPRRAKLREALTALKTCASPAELESLFRASIGTGIHRLDAWVTGVATARLQDALAPLRTSRPSRLSPRYGAFGCLLDLRPGPRESSGGYVLAPSLAHARVAALLRSGYAAYGDAAGLAVDLSSERVRLARWIFDAVRQGQGLSEVLGELFERELHRTGSADLIPSFRSAVAAGLGLPAEHATGIVDGFVLARVARPALQRAEPLDASETKVEAQVQAVLKGARGRAADALAKLDAALDALADTSLADALHGLLEGDDERVRATLEAVDRGTAAPPALEGLSLRRGGRAVHHQIGVLLPPAGEPFAAGLFPLVEPRIEAWLARLFGASTRFTFDAVYAAPPAAQRKTFTVSAAELGAGYTDLLALTPEGTLAGSALERLLVALACDQAPAGASPAPPRIEAVPAKGTDGLTLAELLAALGRVRELLARATSLGPVHLGAPAATPPKLPVDETYDALTGRVAALRRRLDAITALADPAHALPSALELTQARLLLCLLSPTPLALPAIADAGLRSWLGEQSRRARARLAADLTTQDRLRELVGSQLPALTVWAIPRPDTSCWLWEGRSGPPRWIEPAARGSEVARWIDELAPTRSSVGALSDAVLAGECMGGAAGEWAAFQVPAQPSGWIGLNAPTPEAAGALRSDIYGFVLLGAAPGAAVGNLCGFVLEGFVERIPDETAAGGIAFHWDAPAARAPQSILVVCPDPATARSPEGLADVLSDTLALARERTVAPEDLFSEPTSGIGEFLPALMVPDEVRARIAIELEAAFANADFLSATPFTRGAVDPRTP
jgi:hypothetical protein